MATLRAVEGEVLPELAGYGQVMTPAETATVLEVNRSSLVMLMRTGKFPGFRVGGTWRVRRSDVQDVMQGRWVPSTPTSEDEDDDS